MEKFDYDEARRDARALIDEFGASVTFNRVGGGTFDPVAGQETGQTTTTETVKMVSLPMSVGRRMFDNKIFEGLSITETRFMQTEVNDNEFEPASGDLVPLEGKVWEVFGVTPLDPTGGKPVMYGVGVKLSGRSAIP